VRLFRCLKNRGTKTGDGSLFPLSNQVRIWILCILTWLDLSAEKENRPLDSNVINLLHV